MIPTVFVVDDDESVCRAIIALAESMGMRGISFRSAEEFLHAKQTERPACLVADIVLDGMSGVDLQEYVSQQGNPIPIIVISAFANVPTAVRAMERGAVTLIEKPCEVRNLANGIKTSIETDIRQIQLEQHLNQLKTAKEKLTIRERKVLDYLLIGELNKEIARSLEVSMRTIEGDRAKILHKFKVSNAVELAVKYTEYKMLSDRNYRIDRPAQLTYPHWESNAQHVLTD